MKLTSSKFFLVGLILAGCALMVHAQDALQTAVAKPCPDENTPGRPTLKQRQNTPDNSQTVAAEKSDSQKCDPKNVTRPPSDSATVPLRFEGLFNLDEADLRRYIKTHRDEAIPAGSKSGSEYLNGVASLVKNFLESSGYRHAKVTAQADTNAESEAAVFVIEQGVRLPIAEYRFEGNHIFPTATLANELSQCMAGYNRDYYDIPVFEYCLHKVAGFVKSQGYIKAQFHNPRVTESETGLILTIQAEEGLIYRVGEIKFEGDLLTAVANLPTLCPIRKGEIINGDLLSKWLFQDLKQLYGERGYIQYTADVTPEYRTTAKGEGIVDLNFNIDAGRRFSVRRITFTGENLPPNLSDLMLVHDGEVYNQELFERSIQTLNNTGLFEFIDKEKDTDYRISDEEGWLDVAIKLSRKSH